MHRGRWRLHPVVANMRGFVDKVVMVVTGAEDLPPQSRPRRAWRDRGFAGAGDPTRNAQDGFRLHPDGRRCACTSGRSWTTTSFPGNASGVGRSTMDCIRFPSWTISRPSPARKGSGTSSCLTCGTTNRGRASPIWNTRLWPRSWGVYCGLRKSSIATPRTRATWSCCTCSQRRRSGSNGLIRC